MEKRNAKPKVVCYGEILWDISPKGKTPGGAPMNVAAHLNRLGTEAFLISRVGNDELGVVLKEYLRDLSISTDFIQQDPSIGTSKVIVNLSDKENAKYIFDTPTAWDYIAADEDNLRLVQSADLLVFGTLANRNEVSRNSLQKLLEVTSSTVFDVNLRPPFVDNEFIRKGLEKASVVKLNEEELATICGWFGFSGSEEEQLRFLEQRFRLEALCLTLGGDGAMLLEGGKLYRQSGFKVKVTDTIGAGDSFLAAYISQWLEGSSPEVRLRYACAVGALVASRMGANPVIRAEEIEQIMEKGTA